VIVIADVDPAPGVGAFFGELHAEISKGLGAVGYVTNGAVRDLPALSASKFQCFAGGTSVSHAYAHLVDIAEPIEIGGLTIHSGDLLHADCHGVLKVPVEIAPDLPGVVSQIAERERQLVELCRQPHFSIEQLRLAVHEGKEHIPELRR